jgi:hypothetical protein
MKTEPFDLYLYHQSEASIVEIAQLAPAVIVLARRYGFPKNDDRFIRTFRSETALKAVPLVLSLLEGMPIPSERADITVIVSKPNFSDLDDIIETIHRILSLTPSSLRD